MLSQASMPHAYWSYVVHIAVNLVNLLPTLVLKCVSPWFKLYSSKPDLSQLRVFGCACYPNLRVYTSHKLEPRTKGYFFLGYFPTSKGYLCLDLQSKSVCTSRHVWFNKTRFPFSQLSSTLHSPTSSSSGLSTSLWLSNLLFLHSTKQSSLLGPYSPPSQPQSSSTLPHFPTQPQSPFSNVQQSHPSLSSNLLASTHSSSLVLPQSTIPILPIATLPKSSSIVNSIPPILPITNHHPMQTRCKSDITKPKSKFCYKVVLDYTYTEPLTYKIAFQYPKWCEAMDAEFQALQRQNTWILVPAPPHANLVGCKWVFKLK